MPVPALKSLVEKSKSNKTLSDAERYWEEAKEQAEESGLTEGNESFYKYVMGIVKKRLGLSSYSKIARFVKLKVKNL